MSKATEADSAGRPSRSSDRSRRQFHPASLWWEDLGPTAAQCLPGTNGSERHRSRSGERGRRDRGHGSERCHESSRFHHSPRHRESGKWARPTSSSGGSSSRSKQADSTDVTGYGRASCFGEGDGCLAFYFHSSSASSQSLSSSSRASVGRTSSKGTEAETAGRLSRSRDKKRTLSSGVSVVGRSRSDGGPMISGTNRSERHRLRSGVWGKRGHGSERLHDSPRSRHSPRRRRSGERTRPTSSGGFSSRARHADPTDVTGSGRALGRATEVWTSSSATHHQRHHLRSLADRRPGLDPSFMTDVRVWTA